MMQSKNAKMMGQSYGSSPYYGKKEGSVQNLPAPQTQNITAYVPKSSSHVQSEGYSGPVDGSSKTTGVEK